MVIVCTGLVVGGCLREHEVELAGVNDHDVGLELAALMADGELPSTMSPPQAMPPELPPRFCGGGGSPSPDEQDADGGAAAAAGSPAAGGVIGAPLPPVLVSAGRGGSPAADGGVADAGQPGPDPACAAAPIGFWPFDDCNTFRTELSDASFQQHTAFRSVDLACTAGQQGQAVAFSAPEDLVYVPDQPDFGLDAGVTVAAWVKPDAVDGVRTLFRKRDDMNSAFALVINRGKFQFVVRLASGRLAAVETPATAGRWTHVAASYDRTYLRLYIDGSEASRTRAPGVIARGVGPLLMGNDAAGRRFDGTMDNAWFNTMAAPDATIRELLCLQRNPLVAVAPEVGPAVTPGTVVPYALTITNANPAVCPPASFASFVSLPQQEFSAEPSFEVLPPLASGESTTLSFAVASGSETEAGSYTLRFQVFTQNLGGGVFLPGGFFGAVGFGGVISTVALSAAPVVAPAAAADGASTATSEPAEAPETLGVVQVDAQYVVLEPSGCHVSSQRELMIRHVSVVDDPVRTSLDGPAGNPNTGAWSFGRLMERLSPAAADAPDVTETMFRTFLSAQTVNGFTVSPRLPMADIVLQPWPRTPAGKLDLARAPMRLLAIAHRLDLKDLAKGKAGEGRMVYGVLDAAGNSLEFTVIFEYLLPADDEAGFRGWADAIHALQLQPFPSEEYNQALQAITDRFTGRGAMPDLPNGSALIDIRTNEIALSLDGQWQLREFRISPSTGLVVPATVALTPDTSFNFGDRLGRFINANEASVLTETHEVPASFEQASFLGGAVFNNIDFWDGIGITNPEARHKFSLNTCNGCHGAETQTAFLHVNPRLPGEQSFLSGFLTGVTVGDPVTGQSRRLSELARRRQLLERVVCEGVEP